MKYLSVILLSVATFFHFKNLSIKNNIKQAPDGPGIAILELFTSQGCSSCPSADKLISQTVVKAKEDGKNIIALSFHVDYWDRLGWKDPYSKKEWTQRQYQYSERFRSDGVYTPQVVVNGTEEFVGSNKSKLDNAIQKALKVPSSVEIKIDEIKWNDKNISVKSGISGKIDNTDIFAVLISKHTSTSIPRGENAGITLSGNNVVREMIILKNATVQNFSINIPSDLKKDNAAIIVFAQDIKTKRITGGTLKDF